MNKVFKYPVKIEDHVTLEMPKGAKLLSFQCQYDQPCLWALVDPEAPLESRTFRFVGTGHPIEEPAEKLSFVGTAQMRGGALIWHLFEITEVELGGVMAEHECKKTYACSGVGCDNTYCDECMKPQQIESDACVEFWCMCGDELEKVAV